MKENEKNEEEVKLNKTLSYTPEIENIFQMIYQEKIEELSKYILNEKNEVWDIKRSDGLTLLHSACIFDKTNIVETIVNDTKKRLNLLSSETLPLEEKTKNEKIFKDFINSKTEKDSLTALHYASFRGNIKIIKLLIENKAEINAVSSHGLNMLHKAAQGNQPSSIVYFNKKYNFDIEATDNNKLNALHLSAISGTDNSVIFLLSLGMDPNIKDKKGNTALHYAVKHSHVRIIKKLLQKGADRNIKNNSNKTPVMLAQNKPEVLEIFRNKGICEKLFFKPEINQKNIKSIQNIIFFIICHIIINFLVFFILLPYCNNTYFSIGYLLISVLDFVLYAYLYFSDPGVLTNKEYENILDIVEDCQQLELFCPYCLVKQKYRTIHCLICQKCIDEFDHHCFWVGNCIGKNNYILFFFFLVYVILNILFNIGITIYFLINEIVSWGGKRENDAFPGYYFGADCFIYNLISRTIASIFIFIICIIFFVPLFDLFRAHLNIILEKRKSRIDEEEYEKNRLIEKSEESIDTKDKSDHKEKIGRDSWEDVQYEEDQNNNISEEISK